MLVEPDELRFAMRNWATGVTIVATQYENICHGMTVSSFTSVSLEPPLVLVSLEMRTRTLNLVEQARVFGITILSNLQQEVSNCFANPNTELGDRFAGQDYFTLETGAPFIKGGMAYFDCRVHTMSSVGNHKIVVGEVVAVKIEENDDTNKPLLYFNQGYQELK